MWIFTTRGFVSIVSKDCPQDSLMVRARFKGDIEAIFAGHNIKVRRTDDADYAFRSVVTRQVVAEVLATQAFEINYSNFKDANNKKRSGLLMKIWTALFNEQNAITPRKGRWNWSAPKEAQPKLRASTQPYYQDSSFDDWLTKQRVRDCLLDREYPLPEDHRRSSK